MIPSYFLSGSTRFDLRVAAPPSGMALYRFKPHPNPRLAAQAKAIELGETKHGFPDILQLGVGDGPRVNLTEGWQRYIRDLNPNLPVEKVSALLNYRVAFTNGTGFGDDEDPRRNFLLNENLNSPIPQLDKVRTCGYAIHTGREEGGELVLTILNGNLPPPNISEVNPVSHPWLFFHATIVWVDTNGRELSRVPFQQRAPAWGFDFPITIMPLVSMYQIRIPLSMVERVSEYSLPYLNYP